MAKEKESKNNQQPATVEQKLQALYELQTILSEIDRIKTIRGELPLEVKDLEDMITGLHTRIENYNREISDAETALANEKVKIENSKALIARYKEQLDNVRNNREFDMLTKEIEYQTLEIQLSEKHINEYSRIIENKKADVEATEARMADHSRILEEKKRELTEIVSETRQEEENLRERAKKVEPRVEDDRLLTAFKRIRKNARNGLGVVYVQRNACGGCFNRIPPQKQMEIKMHKKVIVCEYCGRIMIDPQLAGIEENA